MYERTGELIRDKFKEYLLPTVLTSMAVSMASVVDGAIVGNLLGDRALAAVGLAGPIIFCINLIYMLFGVGGLTCASVARGQRDQKQANLIFTLTMGGGLIAMLIFSVIMQFILAPISESLAGSDAELAKLLEQYLTWDEKREFTVCTTTDAKVFYNELPGFAGDCRVRQEINGVLLLNNIWDYATHHYTHTWMSKRQKFLRQFEVYNWLARMKGKLVRSMQKLVYRINSQRRK